MTAKQIAYTHPTPRHVRGQRHQTEVHVLTNQAGSTVGSACGRVYSLYEAPHTSDGVRLTTDRPVTCASCRTA